MDAINYLGRWGAVAGADSYKLAKYADLISELVPYVENADAKGLTEHVAQNWPLADIILVDNILSMLATCKTLEEEEAWLAGLFHVTANSAYITLGWWGAVAGDERDKTDPLTATAEQLEETINRKGDAKSGGDVLNLKEFIKEQVSQVEKRMDNLEANTTRGAAAAEAARDAATANGGLLAAIKRMVSAILGRGRDNPITPMQLAELISEAFRKMGRDSTKPEHVARTIQNWNAYLKGKPHGTKPPDGYTLDTCSSIERAQDFAVNFVKQDLSKLRTKVAFNDIHERRAERERRGVNKTNRT